MVEEPITVEIDRSGGFGGIVFHARADTTSLPASQAAHLVTLVRQADVENISPATAAPPVPDAFEYRIVVTRGGRRSELRLTDQTVPADLRPLLTFVLKQGPGKQGPGRGAGPRA